MILHVRMDGAAAASIKRINYEMKNVVRWCEKLNSITHVLIRETVTFAMKRHWDLSLTTTTEDDEKDSCLTSPTKLQSILVYLSYLELRKVFSPILLKWLIARNLNAALNTLRNGFRCAGLALNRAICDMLDFGFLRAFIKWNFIFGDNWCRLCGNNFCRWSFHGEGYESWFWNSEMNLIAL